MKIYLSIFMLIFSFNVIGQSELEKVKFKDKYSQRTHTHQELNEYYFQLNPLANSSSKYHFRFDKEGQIIDLFSEDGDLFEGRIINHIYEYKDVRRNYGKESVINGYIYETKELDESLASEVGKYLIDKKAYAIPTDSLIPNWNLFWFDCGGISLESKINSKIFLSSYSCHWNQADSVKYITQIKEINEKIIQILQLERSYADFKSKLKRGKTYSSDGHMLQYILTKREQKKRKKEKPQRDYLESISDTITNYLVNQINSLISNSSSIDCYDEYYIYFSKRGKLKKIKGDIELREIIFDKDYRKCRRILKKAMKKIKIDFVDPKYKFIRQISFYRDGIDVYDPTIY